MFIYFEVFLLFSLAFFVLKTKQPLEDIKYTPPVSIPLFIIIMGIIFRITLIPAVPTTSPDVYRYLWEGKVTFHGINPYQVPPGSPLLNQYHSDIWAKIGFKDMTTIYPPFAQLAFIVGHILSGDSVWGLKVVFLVCELITLIFFIVI